MADDRTLEELALQGQRIADAVEAGVVTLQIPSELGDRDVRDLPGEGRLLDSPIGGL